MYGLPSMVLRPANVMVGQFASQVSSRCSTVVLVGESIPGVHESTDNVPPVWLRMKDGVLFAVPTPNDAVEQFQHGGCYITSNSPGFPSRYPIPLHDVRADSDGDPWTELVRLARKRWPEARSNFDDHFQKAISQLHVYVAAETAPRLASVSAIDVLKESVCKLGYQRVVEKLEHSLGISLAAAEF